MRPVLRARPLSVLPPHRRPRVVAEGLGEGTERRVTPAGFEPQHPPFPAGRVCQATSPCSRDSPFGSRAWKEDDITRAEWTRRLGTTKGRPAHSLRRPEGERPPLRPGRDPGVAAPRVCAPGARWEREAQPRALGVHLPRPPRPPRAFLPAAPAQGARLPPSRGPAPPPSAPRARTSLWPRPAGSGRTCRRKKGRPGAGAAAETTAPSPRCAARGGDRGRQAPPPGRGPRGGGARRRAGGREPSQ